MPADPLKSAVKHGRKHVAPRGMLTKDGTIKKTHAKKYKDMQKAGKLQTVSAAQRAREELFAQRVAALRLGLPIPRAHVRPAKVKCEQVMKNGRVSKPKVGRKLQGRKLKCVTKRAGMKKSAMPSGMKERAALVKDAFAAVRKVKGAKKVDVKKVMQTPEGAMAAPRKYLM